MTQNDNGGSAPKPDMPAPKPDETIVAATVAAIKKEASSYLAKAIVGGIVAIFGAALLGIWIYLKTFLPVIAGGVPVGAVVAFDSPGGCPSGWSHFERGVSRVIIGASNTHGASVLNQDRNGYPLTARPYQQDGGEERHLLTTDEMPSHDHGLQIVQHSEYVREKGYVGTEAVGRDVQRTDPKWPVRFSELAGGGKAFNVMSPFVALYLCKKDQ